MLGGHGVGCVGGHGGIQSQSWPDIAIVGFGAWVVKRKGAHEYEGRGGVTQNSSQKATTRYRRLATTELPHSVDRCPTSRYALVLLEPLTGRRHQLRHHLKHHAHPIIGDATYGKGRHNRLFHHLIGCGRMLLACVELRFIHPVKEAALTLTAPP